ncbi:hypothetical protein BH20ACI2_BH20ACI2_08860 [soil metagenome]
MNARTRAVDKSEVQCRVGEPVIAKQRKQTDRHQVEVHCVCQRRDAWCFEMLIVSPRAVAALDQQFENSIDLINPFVAIEGSEDQDVFQRSSVTARKAPLVRLATLVK